MQGILFTPDNHKAIREGRKTQTRRLDHLKEINKEPDKWFFVEQKEGSLFLFGNKNGQKLILKPRYRVGGTVYIKEAWFVGKQYDALSPIGLWHHPPVGFMSPFSEIAEKEYGKVRSPLFLPSWAARSFIKITDVKPERLWDITEEDAIKEGVTRPPNYSLIPHYRVWFKYWWDKINKAYPFDRNYWLWRICFNLIEKEVK